MALTIIGRVYDAVAGFKGALFGKKEGELDKWVEETEVLEIDELESFINGIKRGYYRSKKRHSS